MYDEDEGGNRIAALRKRLLAENAAASSPAIAAPVPAVTDRNPVEIELYDADHYDNTLVRRGVILRP